MLALLELPRYPSILVDPCSSVLRPSLAPTDPDTRDRYLRMRCTPNLPFTTVFHRFILSFGFHRFRRRSISAVFRRHLSSSPVDRIFSSHPSPFSLLFHWSSPPHPAAPAIQTLPSAILDIIQNKIQVQDPGAHVMWILKS